MKSVRKFCSGIWLGAGRTGEVTVDVANRKPAGAVTVVVAVPDWVSAPFVAVQAIVDPVGARIW
ncbi:hypothetical protein G5T42_05115 [Microbacterium sp. 4R-513]|uniref:hypothetical protein n=1 Tax=Microbacterium sp. 4R-513 TaxID=2567934 RepID=UPI0013E178A5|nr:hypothetical protein [Microbacterium sp. 4R-513]QIG38944.1 hypothetical protein G5T42_05115 [Microbacterium sp. 4R-513]